MLSSFFPCHWISPFILSILLFSRTFMAIIGGVIAGILGLNSLTGFIFYFLVMAMTSVALTAKAKFSIHSYFDSWNRILLDGCFGGLMSFVLFWTYPSYVRFAHFPPPLIKLSELCCQSFQVLLS
ncbi:hypothetical protein RDI58_017582 [Solanum bulbocastanum]|uniref:ER membrane protein complex subunit 6 n=1 Tax=Solanum bulbocastanum TaxID=147425 RepID=A0AAN8T906_SOLBU